MEDCAEMEATAWPMKYARGRQSSKSTIVKRTHLERNKQCVICDIHFLGHVMSAFWVPYSGDNAGCVLVRGDDDENKEGVSCNEPREQEADECGIAQRR